MKASIPTGRPTLAEINLKAPEFNYRQIQKRLPVGVNVSAVAEADPGFSRSEKPACPAGRG